MHFYTVFSTDIDSEGLTRALRFVRLLRVVRVARLVLGVYFVMQTTLTLPINMVVRVARLVL